MEEELEQGQDAGDEGMADDEADDDEEEEEYKDLEGEDIAAGGGANEPHLDLDKHLYQQLNATDSPSCHEEAAMKPAHHNDRAASERTQSSDSEATTEDERPFPYV